MRRPLATRSGTIGIAPLALKPVLQTLAHQEPLIEGDAVAPFDLERELRAQFRLLGAHGIVGMALAGIDMAAWDVLARARGLPLVRLLGAERAGAEAELPAAPGSRAIKVRLG